jgi:hypothetical protein
MVHSHIDSNRGVRNNLSASFDRTYPYERTESCVNDELMVMAKKWHKSLLR